MIIMMDETEVWGWESYFSEVQSFLRQVQRMDSGRQEHIEYCLERLSTVISGTTRIREVISQAMENSTSDAILSYYKTALDEVLISLGEVYVYLNECLDRTLSAPYSSSVVRSGLRGRPRFNVTVDQLAYLISLSFSWVQIAQMLGISRMTLYRRRVEFNMVQRGRRIRYPNLVELLQEMRVEYPYLGEVMILGRLRALGYYVCRAQVRRAIRQTDPINTSLRATTGALIRRVYSVPGPNSLWHIGMFLLLQLYSLTCAIL